MNAPKLFGTSGIRGDAEKLFTNQFCFDIGRSFAEFLTKHNQKGPVAIGMDPRFSSLRILRSVSRGLLFENRQVFNQGIAPVPAMNFVLKAFPYAGSIMVTGSHIAENLNGLKFFAFQEEISKKGELEIERIYSVFKQKVLFKKVKTNLKPLEEEGAKQAYQKMLNGLANSPYPHWQVVVDAGNGAQAGFMTEIFVRLGINVIALNNSLKNKFISRDTEVEGAFAPLQKKVIAEKADFGIAFDADGDRVIFVDEKGKFVPGDYTGALLAKYSKSDIVITPINTSQVANFLGKKVIRTKIGSGHVIEAMKKHQAAFGFEANGGGISAEVMMSRDGGSTAIKILNLLKKSGKRFSEFIGTLPRYALYRTKVACPTNLYKKIYLNAKKNFPGKKTENLGCLKIWIDDSSWILFRGSGNAPEFRVFAEAKKANQAKKLADEGMKLVKDIIKRNK